MDTDKKIKKILTIFPWAENIHLTKDVGMMPYIFGKYYGYKATLACYKNGEYPYIDKEVKGLDIVYIKKVFNKPILDGAFFLLMNARKYDVLMSFHLAMHSLVWLFLYKKLNCKGVSYLKLDANDSIMNQNLFHTKTGLLYERLLKKLNLISIETKKIHHYLNQYWKMEVLHLPNGFYDWGQRKTISFLDKENVIITVGRIGSEVKDTQCLLQALSEIGEYSTWKIYIIGPIEPNFKAQIDLFYRQNPKLKHIVFFTGAIYDRDLLEQYYQKAKVFVLTSKWEGFALVYLEAIKNGCYIVSTDITPAYDVTNNGEHGSCFSVGDSDTLASILIQIMEGTRNIEANCELSQKYAYEHFYWPTLIGKLNEKITKNLIN
jgi:glycosyltransferase involved in cell wall biosynthesis